MTDDEVDKMLERIFLELGRLPELYERAWGAYVCVKEARARGGRDPANEQILERIYNEWRVFDVLD